MKPTEIAAYFAAIFANWPDCALTKEERAAVKQEREAFAYLDRMTKVVGAQMQRYWEIDRANNQFVKHY